MKTITLRLAGPLQSYGDEASYERRTTGDAPSKSAIVGLVAAALGYHRNDPRITALNDLVYAVRRDQVGQTLTDFHLVEWKPKTRKLTYRDYLQDAVFVVALASEDEELIYQIEWAIRHPKFQLYLGRRANAPTGRIVLGVTDGQGPIETLKRLPWQASLTYQQRYYYRSHKELVTVEILADAVLLPGYPIQMQKDNVKSFRATDRNHGFRAVAVLRQQIPLQMTRKETQHDVMRAMGEE